MRKVIRKRNESKTSTWKQKGGAMEEASTESNPSRPWFRPLVGPYRSRNNPREMATHKIQPESVVVFANLPRTPSSSSRFTRARRCMRSRRTKTCDPHCLSTNNREKSKRKNERHALRQKNNNNKTHVHNINEITHTSKKDITYQWYRLGRSRAFRT